MASKLPLARALVVLVALAAWPAFAVADPPTERSAAPLPSESAFERFRWYGEELIYTVQILGSEGARAGLAAGYPEDRDGIPSIRLHGLVQSVGLLSGVFAIEDVADTWIETATGLPLYAVKDLNERNQQRRYEVTYHQLNHRADIERVRDGRDTRFFRYVPSDLYDALSWIYDLRSRDLDVGQEYVYHIYDGWKLSRLTVRVIRHRIVITGMGNIQAAEFEFVREVLGSSLSVPWAASISLPPVYSVSEPARRVGVGWVSTDPRRLPLGVAIDTPIGSVRILLDDWTAPDASFRPNPALAVPSPTRMRPVLDLDLPSEDELEPDDDAAPAPEQAAPSNGSDAAPPTTTDEPTEP